jgi:hypothetical protein
LIYHNLFAVFWEVVLAEVVEETGVLFETVDGDEGIELTLVFPCIEEAAIGGLLIGYEDNIGFSVYT